MSKRRKIIILLGFGLLVTSFLLFRREREPTYKGRSLSEWVLSYAVDTNQTDAAAIREIGTNAIPWLVRWMLYHPRPTKDLWIDRVNKPIQWLNERLDSDHNWTIDNRDQNRASAAIVAFRTIYPDANLTVLELANLLNAAENNPPDSWNTADYAAGRLTDRGEDGLPPLLAAMNGSNGLSQVIALSHATRLGTNALAAVPSLTRILAKDSGGPTWMAAEILGELKLAPNIVIPALIESLASTNDVTRMKAAFALAEFGPQARPAIPTLTNWLTGSEIEHKRVATRALHAIDPLTFTNTPPPIRANP